MNIRAATMEDREGMWRVHTRAIRELCSPSYPAEAIAAWAARLSPDSYNERLQSRIMLVAESNGQVVGFGQLYLATAEIEAVYVDPAHNGAGIGTRLLSGLEDAARRRGLERLNLCSTLNAETFYARHGYRAQSREQHALNDQHSVECIRMTKDLA